MVYEEGGDGDRGGRRCSGNGKGEGECRARDKECGEAKDVRHRLSPSPTSMKVSEEERAVEQITQR